MNFKFVIVSSDASELIQLLESGWHIVSATGVGGSSHYVMIDGNTVPQSVIPGVEIDDHSDSTSIES